MIDMIEDVKQVIIVIAFMLLVVAPVFLLTFIVLVASIGRYIKDGIRDGKRGKKSVQTLINEVSGYREPEPDPIDAFLEQALKDGKSQVDEKITGSMDDFLNIKM